MSKNSRLASSPQDYKKLEISPNKIQNKEDGLHITGSKNEYEWWYFDANLDDGGTLVIIFHYRSFVSHKPIIQFNYTPKKGKAFEQVLRFDNNQAHADMGGCNVVMKKNYFRGNLSNYEIHIDEKGLCGDIQLNTLTSPWRPKTGYLYFDNDTKYFAWLPSVPYGKVTGSCKINGKKINIKGYGYHDHNWGNEGFMKLFDHWYWGRAHASKYNVISSFLMGAKAYDLKTNILFMIQEGNKIITKDDPSFVKLDLQNFYLDKETNKRYAKNVMYTYDDSINKFVVKYQAHKIIKSTRFIDKLPVFEFNDKLRNLNIQAINKLHESLDLHKFHGLEIVNKVRLFNRNLTSKVLKFSAAYLRFNGVCEITIYKNNVLKEKISSPATWELMALANHQ